MSRYRFNLIPIKFFQHPSCKDYSRIWRCPSQSECIHSVMINDSNFGNGQSTRDTKILYNIINLRIFLSRNRSCSRKCEDQFFLEWKSNQDPQYKNWAQNSKDFFCILYCIVNSFFNCNLLAISIWIILYILKRIHIMRFIIIPPCIKYLNSSTNIINCILYINIWPKKEGSKNPTSQKERK